MRTAIGAAGLVAALAVAGAAPAARGGAARSLDDGGTGSYVARGATVYFDLVNTGSASWQSFVVVGPPGTVFVGATTGNEGSARCTPGQPDGSPDEIACGPPLATSVAPPLAHVGFVATLAAPPACGAVFRLRVTSGSTGASTAPTDMSPAGPCGNALPHAVRAPVVHGTPRVGRTLVATPPVWSAPPTSVAYRWQACHGAACAALAGATRLRLTLTRSDVHRSVRLVAAATIDGRTVTASSKLVAVSG